MTPTLKIILFLIFLATTFGKKIEKRNSRLILEYDWPEPKKNLHRFPHVASCSHFYVIRPDGTQVIKKCPENEMFDYGTLRCQNKASAKCWNELFKKGHLKKKEVKKTKKSFKCPLPWGTYPDTEDCSMFFDCLRGKPFHRKCPELTLFDEIKGRCVKESDAACADPSDIVEPGYKCPYKWGFFTHSKNCSKYYVCIRKIPMVRSCRKNMLFDNFQRKCLPMSDVECGKRFNPYGGNQATTDSKSNKNIREMTEGVPKENERVTTSERISQADGRENANPVPTESERIATKQDLFGLERVTNFPIHETGDLVTNERVSFGLKKVTSEHFLKEIEQVNDERTELKRVTREHINGESEPVTNESTELKRVTLEHINRESEPVTNEPTELKRVTSEHINRESERVSNERVPAGLGGITSERIPGEVELVTNKYVSVGLKHVISEDIRRESEQVTNKRVPDELKLVNREIIPKESDREQLLKTTERIPIELKQVTNKHVLRESDQVTDEHVPIGLKELTNEYINEEGKRVTTDHLPSENKGKTNERRNTEEGLKNFERISTKYERIITDSIPANRESKFASRVFVGSGQMKASSPRYERMTTEIFPVKRVQFLNKDFSLQDKQAITASNPTGHRRTTVVSVRPRYELSRNEYIPRSERMTKGVTTHESMSKSHESGESERITSEIKGVTNDPIIKKTDQTIAKLKPEENELVTNIYLGFKPESTDRSYTKDGRGTNEQHTVKSGAVKTVRTSGGMN